MVLGGEMGGCRIGLRRGKAYSVSSGRDIVEMGNWS